MPPSKNGGYSALHMSVSTLYVLVSLNFCNLQFAGDPFCFTGQLVKVIFELPH